MTPSNVRNEQRSYYTACALRVSKDLRQILKKADFTRFSAIFLFLKRLYLVYNKGEVPVYSPSVFKDSFWMTHLTIDGLPVTIETKEIRHLYIRVSMKDGSVHISAPKSMDFDELKRHVVARRGWIAKNRDRAFRHPSASSAPLPHNAGSVLKKRLMPLIPVCEELVGQSAAGYRLKDMTSRWGSCSLKTRQISLNVRLYDKDDDCLKYVLIHELTHFYVPNHGPAFYHYMDMFYPEWKTVRKKLHGSV